MLFFFHIFNKETTTYSNQREYNCNFLRYALSSYLSGYKIKGYLDGRKS